MTSIYFKYLNLEAAKKILKPRSKDAHKGDFGQVLIVGGNYGMGGAARIAGEAALTVGAGSVTVATRPEHARMLGMVTGDLMTAAIESSQDLAAVLERSTVVAVGPGLGKDAWAKDLLTLILKSELPLVVDADALNLLAEYPEPIQNNRWILTPHPGEASRLLNQPKIKIQQDRIAALYAIQKKYHGVVVLKGAGTLVLGEHTQDPEVLPEICPYGNPGMAKAGMGDSLTGIIAGLCAQKLSLLQASQLGVLMHALAADQAVKETGEQGLRVQDLLRFLPSCLN